MNQKLSTKPTVSVIVPAYNHAPYVERSIESVLSQDYAPLELIVIDDGSKDDTWEVIQAVQKKSHTPFVALTQKNQGVCRTLNRGIEMSKGELIALVASDDYFLPGKLSAQVDAFASAPARVGLVHTSALLDYQNGKPFEDLTGSYRPALGSCFDDVLTQAVRIIAPSMMFRRSMYDEIGGFDENLAAEDVDYFLRIAAAGYEFAYVDKPLMVKTVVEGSGGSQLRTLIRVHEKILDKHRHRLTPERAEALHTLMYEHLIMLSAGAGDYRLSFETAASLARNNKSLSPFVDFSKWTVRSSLLRALPADLRHRLRLFRSALRR